MSNARDQFITEITCPVSLEIFHTPAQVDCGNDHHLEAEKAEEILKSNKSNKKECPCCRKPITKATPSRTLKSLVESYLEEHPELKDSRYKPTLVADKKTNAPAASGNANATAHAHPAASAAPVAADAKKAVSAAKVDAPVPCDANAAARPAAADAAAVVIADRKAANGHNGELRMFGVPRNYEPRRIERSSDHLHRVSYNVLPNKDEKADVVKILLVGNAEAMKSDFLLAYKDPSIASHSFIATMGIDLCVKHMMVDDKLLKLQIWDTAGQERFRTITTAYYRHVQGIFVIYNVTDEQSFQDVRSWVKNIREHCAPNVVIHLVGVIPKDNMNKVVEQQRGQALATELQLNYFSECHINAAHEITDTFESLVFDILPYTKPKPEQRNDHDSSNRCSLM